MDKIKNIVIVNDFDYIQGGASKVAIQTANMLVEEGYNVYFFSGTNTDTSTIDDRVCKISSNQNECLKDRNRIRGFLNGIYNIKSYNTLKQLLLSLNKEETIVHIHGWTKVLSSSVFKVCFKYSYKVVLTMHDYFTACPNGGYFNYKKNEICHLNPMSTKCVLCNCDSRNYLFKLYRVVRQFVQNKIVKLNDRLTDVISISDFSEKVLKKTLNSKIRIHRVYNPIDLDSKAVSVDYKNNKYYLYVGRVSKEKGVDYFCKHISNMNLKGIVVGDGPELQRLKKLYPNIEFVGWKNPDDVKRYMKSAKALIIPSRWYEASPLTPLEALQYGIPVITSDCNATIDYIKDENNGYKFSFVDNSFIESVLKIENGKLEFRNQQKQYNYISDLIKTYKSLL